MSIHPVVYAVVGMGVVVAGSTHGLLSAMLIAYEMTDDYRIILPIMIAAGLSSIVATLIDRESINHKKLSRRGESVARGHNVIALKHVMVRDFSTVRATDSLKGIVRVAKENSALESLPVVDGHGQVAQNHST